MARDDLVRAPSPRGWDRQITTSRLPLAIMLPALDVRDTKATLPALQQVAFHALCHDCLQIKILEGKPVPRDPPIQISVGDQIAPAATER